MAQWIVRRGDRQHRAESLEQLQTWAREGRFHRDDYIYNPILERWLFAHETPEVAPLLPASPPPPRPAAPASTAQANRTSFGLFIAALLFAFLGYLTGAVMIRVISDVLFLVALAIATWIYIRAGRLAFLSLFYGVGGTLFMFGTHEFVGLLLFLIGIVFAVADLIRNRRWVILSIAAAVILIPVLIIVVGGASLLMKARRTFSAQAETPTAEAQALPVSTYERVTPAPLPPPIKPTAPPPTNTMGPDRPPREVYVTTEMFRIDAQKAMVANEERRQKLGFAESTVWLDPETRRWHFRSCKTDQSNLIEAPHTFASSNGFYMCEEQQQSQQRELKPVLEGFKKRSAAAQNNTQR